MAERRRLCWPLSGPDNGTGLISQIVMGIKTDGGEEVLFLAIICHIVSADYFNRSYATETDLHSASVMMLRLHVSTVK